MPTSYSDCTYTGLLGAARSNSERLGSQVPVNWVWCQPPIAVTHAPGPAAAAAVRMLPSA
jgi:hypothetical protein